MPPKEMIARPVAEIFSSLKKLTKKKLNKLKYCTDR